jgi:uncharacterized protein
MRLIDGTWVLSPRDLIGELECSHRLNLEWAAATKLIEKPEEELDPTLQIIIDNGRAHEQRLVDKHKELGSLVSIPEPGPDFEKVKGALTETLKAIEAGVEVIHQATLFTGDFLGYADFLILTKDENNNPVKDKEGRFVYEPVDAKSARIAKRAAVLQVASYAWAMIKLGMAMPPKVHLWLAGDEAWSANTADLIDLAEEFESRARGRITEYKTINDPNWAAPREACSRCRWKEHCAQGREKDRDLSLIYGIRSTTRQVLIDGGIKTIDQMSVAGDEERKSLKKVVSKETFEKLREQAKIQIKGEGKESPIFEVKNPDELAAIPASSKGDIWFDMEGDPFSDNGAGLEYMFGFLIEEDGKLVFKTFDAPTKDQEAEAFSEFIKFVVKRRAKFPDMHIYHYASYEPATILRLSQSYGLFENEVDDLKRQGVFVDLLSVVKKSLRFSTDSLSIKAIEQVFYPGHRDEDLKEAMESVIAFNLATLARINGDEKTFKEKLQQIRDYNEVDCRSLHSLDSWLRQRAADNGIELLPMIAKEVKEIEQVAEEVELLKDVLPNKEDRDSNQQGAALLASAVSYHRREDKPTWWNIFDKAEKELDELEAYDDVLLFDEISTSSWDQAPNQRTMHRYIEITSNSSGDLRHMYEKGDRPHLLYEIIHEKMLQIAGFERSVNSAAIDRVEESKLVIDETCSPKITSWDELPIALLPEGPIKADKIADVIKNELARSVISARDAGHSPFPNQAWADLLLRRAPRQRSKKLAKSTDGIEDITNSLLDSDNSYVAVQGPPGTGKTYVGARVIAKLIKENGWKIGVVAQSHAVIENLLNAIHKYDPTIPIAKDCKKATNPPSYHQEEVASWASYQQAGYVIGATAWGFANPDIRSLGLDLVVVDEAGQFALANTIAAVSCARCALLLGDPQQLPQVSQGSHPEPVNESSLHHLLEENKTMPEDMGYFLDTTYRLHPLLAKPVSRLQYEDRLQSDQRCSKRSLEKTPPGLHIVRIEHFDNTTRSDEEAIEIIARAKQLLGKSWIDTGKDGEPIDPRPLTEADILVVTAYNAQVKNIKSKLTSAGLSKIKVGTFDKFQGQEAPIVFVSMATSTAEDLPRGIEFLLSPNRLNVAVSRAQWACFLIRSNNLSFMEPASVDGMVMLGKFVTLCK